MLVQVLRLRKIAGMVSWLTKGGTVINYDKKEKNISVLHFHPRLSSTLIFINFGPQGDIWPLFHSEVQSKNQDFLSF